ncbi:RNase H family protein [Striga hermonthica]|uniref:RNase H family protein n=1 Tax=Striga hermonthica TaxID=68872 RepID=A0A9N7NMY4_STRHE|nr:RNase H family protein [Striga hermonthica]
MIGSFRACCSPILSRTGNFINKSSSCKYILPLSRTRFQHLGDRTVNLELLLTKSLFRRYSSKRSSGVGSRKRKLDIKPVMKDDKEAFFVVRKGDLVGVYKSLSDCQAQVGTSICDPPVSVYKGQAMPKDTEKYLMSCGLKNALYSIRASELTEHFFGPLVPCHFQPSSRGETSAEPITKKRPQEALWSDYGEAAEPTLSSNDALPKHFKLEPHRGVDQNQPVCRSCTIEFDGASKGNPGQAGAGAVLRSDDGNYICRLREGLGIATNNFAEYRGFILGLKYALREGFSSVRVRGDSKLVCMQIQGLWRVKNQNISSLYEEARKLKDMFGSFQIIHVLRDLNSEADALANLAVELAEGQVQEQIDK